MADPNCSFCSAPFTDVAWLFASPIGAVPTHICDACVARIAEKLAQDRAHPGFLAGVVAIQKKRLAEKWAESHQGSGAPSL